VLTELEAKQLERENLILMSVDPKKNDFRFRFFDSKGEKHHIHLSFAKKDDVIVVGTYSEIENEEHRVCISEIVQKSIQIIVSKPRYRLLDLLGSLKVHAPNEIILNLDAYTKHLDLVYVYHAYKEQVMSAYENALELVKYRKRREKEPVELIFYGKDGLNLARTLARLRLASYEEQIKNLKYTVTFNDPYFGLSIEGVELFKKKLESLGFMISWY
jgi:hypothetical protein